MFAQRPSSLVFEARSRHLGRNLFRTFAVCLAALTCTTQLVAADQDRQVEVRNGTVAFETGTSMPAIHVRGTSNQLRAYARMRESGDTFTLESLEATLPVTSLSTGLGLRDSHMRKYIFTTAEGSVPDLRFIAPKAECSPNGKALTCSLAGELAIRGRSRPLTIVLNVRNESGSFRAVGDAVAKLSAYDIEAPSQFGVKTDDDVKLHLEFTANLVQQQASNGGGR
jgi:polyisoprenoid-binding protein YceI